MRVDRDHIVPFSNLTDAEQVERALAAASRGNGARRTLWVLLCDRDGDLLQPIAVDHVPPRPPLDSRLGWLRLLTGPLRGAGGAAVLIGIARPGPEECTDDDRLWLNAAETVCDEELRLLGVYLVNRRGIVPVVPR